MESRSDRMYGNISKTTCTSEFRLFFVLCAVIIILMITAWVTLIPKPFTSGVPEQTYLCPCWSGRLGNLMFQYASLYALSLSNGMRLVISADDELNDAFEYLYAEKVENNSFCQDAEIVTESAPCQYDESAILLDSSTNIIHDSLLQSWKYFSHIEDDIREQFRFNERTDILCQQIVDKAVSNWTKDKPREIQDDIQIVGVHIRRGDYLLKRKIEFGYQAADETYINKSMNYFRQKYKNVIFLVYTNPLKDDILWRQKHVKGKDVILMNMHLPEMDMCSLSKCNHTIMTVGSFGWWAAWLANGITVYFKDVARHGSEFREDFSENMTDYFYPGWIGF